MMLLHVHHGFVVVLVTTERTVIIVMSVMILRIQSPCCYWQAGTDKRAFLHPSDPSRHVNTSHCKHPTDTA